MVGIGPQGHHLVGGPDRAAAGQAPEDVVANLVAKQERLAVGGEPPGVVLVPVALRPANVEQEMQAPGDRDEQAEIAGVD